MSARTGRRFVPPHCPNPACRFHLSSRGWRWRRYGFYPRLLRPHRIQRFRCDTCRRTFSTQTFAVDYWLKHPRLLAPVFFRLLACSGFRQIARDAGVRHTSVMRLSQRLGRHCLLYHHRHRPHGPLLEPLVIDGFESFEYSQDHPLYLNLAVGADSHFLYAFTDTELRRKGTRTDRQRERCARVEAQFGRPRPGRLIDDIAQLLRLSVPTPQPLTLRSDEHPVYPVAVRRLRDWQVRHERTLSTLPRTPRNPLFPVNLADLLLRHNSANHKRETIAFSKRRQNALERLAVLLVWRNYMKPFSERHGGATPAMRLGLMSVPLTIRRLLRRRLFPTLTRLPERWRIYYRRDVATRRIPSFHTHRLRFAF